MDINFSSSESTPFSLFSRSCTRGNVVDRRDEVEVPHIDDLKAKIFRDGVADGYARYLLVINI